MGIGAAIGSVVGGVMKMGAAKDQQRAAEAAGLKADEQMFQQSQRVDQALAMWEDQQSAAGDFKSMLDGLSAEYGEHASSMWQDWETTFGSIETNLASYYKNLDPTKFSAQAKSDISYQMQKTNEQFNEAAAQSGIYTSGMRLQNEKENSFKQAEAFANADVQAPEAVNQMKQGFYGQFGAPAKAQAQNTMTNMFGQQAQMGQMGQAAGQYATQGGSNALMSGANMNTQNAQMYAGSAAGYGQAAGENTGAGINMFGSGIDKIVDLF